MRILLEDAQEITDKKKKIGEDALAASTEGSAAVKKLKASTVGGKRAEVVRGGTNTKQVEEPTVKVEVKKGEATSVDDLIAQSKSVLSSLQKKVDEQNSSSSSSSSSSVPSSFFFSEFPASALLSPGAKDCKWCGSKNGLVRAICWKCDVPF